MTSITPEFRQAVIDASEGVVIEAGGIRRKVIDVSGIPGAQSLPRALVVLLENVVRRVDDIERKVEQAFAIVSAGRAGTQGTEIEFMPARVLFQDFTGVPVFVDFAAMRDAMVERGGDPSLVNPRIPCTLVIDHSVIADEAGCAGCAETNERLEARRNRERFAFLKWSSRSFDNVEIVPPGVGICHQLNIERFCNVVMCDALAQGQTPTACFDTLVGTDSHTTTANGVGVLGWGVGGIEAEAAALGQPISMLVPPVVELRLEGHLRDGVSGMDLALTVCELLRSQGVVGTLVEVTGEGVATLSATQRACVANMTPEYGSTTTLFPADDVVMEYLALAGRDEAELAFAKAYLKQEGVWEDASTRTYARTISLDLATVEMSLAGPSRPHNRVTPAGLRDRFRSVAAEHGKDLSERFEVALPTGTVELSHGALAIAAITSCTTATDPAMMVAAGLLASNAAERGLTPKPWVKTILAPGSRATELMLKRAGLTDGLFKLGFFTCGFGCMSCIGNSGDIRAALHELASQMELTSVLSGNRNFDGRISPDVAQNFLCEPALVVAYSLVGTMDADLSVEPVGIGSDGQPVYLRDLMPTDAEVAQVLESVLTPELFATARAEGADGSAAWQEIPTSASATFPWDADSTYVRRAPYFDLAENRTSFGVQSGRALALLGDFVTTDHISPAGSIAPTSPAARYLRERGVDDSDFNTYGARRGNHEVMMRGTFANVRLENELADGRKGGWTLDPVDGQVKSIFDASESAREAKLPLVIVAGKMYGSGSSRDWAGKGPALLGVSAVIAESFERIHRSNLVQMGVLPLQLPEGVTAQTLGLDGTEKFEISAVDVSAGLPVPATTQVRATKQDGTVVTFDAIVRIDTPMEGHFMASGGILPYVLDHLG